MPKKTIKRGFALLSPEERKRIASMGGKISHKLGRGHEWTSKEAKMYSRLAIKVRLENRANKKKK